MIFAILLPATVTVRSIPSLCDRTAHTSTAYFVRRAKKLGETQKNQGFGFFQGKIDHSRGDYTQIPYPISPHFLSEELVVTSLPDQRKKTAWLDSTAFPPVFSTLQLKTRPEIYKIQELQP